LFGTNAHNFPVDETARPKKYILDPRFSLVKNISIELIVANIKAMHSDFSNFNVVLT